MDKRSTLQRSTVTVPLLALGVTAALLSCKPRQASEGLRSLPGECPETWETKDAPFIPQVRARINIPEFHDCQRLVAIDSSRPPVRQLVFDSLYAIFATDGIEHSWAQLAQLSDAPAAAVGRLVAVVYTFGGSTGRVNGDPSTGGTYQPLGIGRGFNCLYLYNRGIKLQARMVQYGANSACADAITPSEPDPTKPYKDLAVNPIKPNGWPSGDVPSVARWDWNPQDSTQYIGVYCGPAWCEIGGQGSPSFTYAHGHSRERRRIAEIKGWYDAQMLDTGPPEHPLPAAWGTIFPVNDLWKKDTTEFQDHWVPVAYVTVSADYNSALVFKKTAAEGPPSQDGEGVKTNIVEYCHGNAVTAPAEIGCYFDTATAPVPPTCFGSPVTDRPWWRRTKDPETGNVIHTKCLKRWDHSTMPGTPEIPGTVRWRWAYGDMLSWGRCGGGCCQ